MAETKQIEPKALQFKANPFEIGVAAENQQRKFSGIAYSGEPIQGHYYWGDVIFDLESMQIDTPLAALLDHDTGRRVGVVTEFSNDNTTGLKVEGDLLSNQFGQQVAQDSDEGFPWQMSVYIDPASIEEIERGQVVVNGRTLQAPITIFRGGRIREVSFCALGADGNTSAVAASHTPKHFTQPEDTNVTEVEQAKAAQAQAEQERDAAQAELNKFKADKREDDIKTLETALNKQFSAEEKKSYTNMDDTSFAFMSQQLKQFSAGSPQPAVQPQQQQIPPQFAHLFSHQATSGQQGQGGNDGSALDQAFNQFAAAQQGAKQ
jgi:hypothetical protein